MYSAADMRRLAEQVSTCEANDLYYNKLEKIIFERIKKTAEEGKTELIITSIEEEDKWASKPAVAGLVKEELEKLGYKVTYNVVVIGSLIAINW